MDNFGIKINVKNLKGAFLTNIVGKGSTKRCIVIAIDDSDLYEGEKGIYLNLSAFALRDPKYAQTHLLKASLEKEAYDAMTPEERNNIPIIGSMNPIVTKQTHTEVNTTAGMSDKDKDDLPF